MLHLNSLAAKESIVNLTYEGTGSSNNSHAQNYILLVLFEVDLCMKRNYFCQSCAQLGDDVCGGSFRTEGVRMTFPHSVEREQYFFI